MGRAVLSIHTAATTDNQRRARIADLYREGLSDANVVLPAVQADVTHAFHLYVVRSQRRDELRRFLAARDINTLIHYPVPVHLQPAYNHRFAEGNDLAETERAAREILSLPLYPEISDVEVHQVIEAMQQFGRAESATNES